MTDIAGRLAQLLRAHAPAMTSAGPGSSLGPDLDLRDDLGFDTIALAELAIGIEDAFEIDVDVADLARCPTVGDLASFIAAKAGRHAL